MIETKSIDAIGPLQVAQVLAYLRFLNIRYGLILNCNTVLMKRWNKTSFKRGFNDPPQSRIAVSW